MLKYFYMKKIFNLLVLPIKFYIFTGGGEGVKKRKKCVCTK